MSGVYKFIAGDSRVTPIGIAVAVVLAVGLHPLLGRWSGVVYIGVLLATLAAAVFETVP